jgi:heme exporter protein D
MHEAHDAVEAFLVFIAMGAAGLFVFGAVVASIGALLDDF